MLPISTLIDLCLTPTAVGWNFSSILCATQHAVFPDKFKIITESGYIPSLHQERTRGPPPSWELNYSALSFLLNGQYYSEYQRTFGLMGFPVMCEKAWQKLVAPLVVQLEAIAMTSCEQVQEKIIH